MLKYYDVLLTHSDVGIGGRDKKKCRLPLEFTSLS